MTKKKKIGGRIGLGKKKMKKKRPLLPPTTKKAKKRIRPRGSTAR